MFPNMPLTCVRLFSTEPLGSGSVSYNWAVFVYTVVKTVYCQHNTVDSFPNMTSFFCFIVSSVQFDILICNTEAQMLCFSSQQHIYMF